MMVGATFMNPKQAYFAAKARQRLNGHSVGGRQLVGASTLVGDGASQLMGVNPGASGPPVLIQAPPTQARQLPLGVASTTVAASGGTVTITSSAQMIFRPLRLFFFETITLSTTITNIVIGPDTQLINPSIGLPTQAFANNATDSLINFDTCDIGQNFQVSVSNAATTTVTFSGMVIAVAARK